MAHRRDVRALHRAALLAALGLSLCAAFARAASYSAPAIRGRVVDDQSGEPLAGVNVVARWVLMRDVIPGLVSRAENDTLEVHEAVTDAQGRYTIPAWGPVGKPFFGHLEDQDPVIHFFRPGWYPRAVQNRPRLTDSGASVRISEWDGKDVRLRRFTGEPQRYEIQDGRIKDTIEVSGKLEDYARRVRTLQDSLNWFADRDDWKHYPRMVRTLRDERERLAAAGLDPNYQIGQVSLLQGGASEVERTLRSGSP